MIVFVGGGELKKAYLWNTEIKKIYVGDKLVYWNRVPTAYQEVEYIQSSGSQYIDTGYKPTSTTRLYIKATQSWVAEHTGLFGSRDSNYSASFLSYIEFSRWWYSNIIRIDIGSYQGTTANWSTNTPFTIDINLVTHRVTVNGSVYTNFNWKTFTPSSYQPTLALFANHDYNNGYQFPIAWKLYTCQIYNNGTLVRDFIPCYRKSDNVIGLYDIVNNTFYTNSGSWSFTKGPNV